MNVKCERVPIKKSQLENEVILAVVALYALLSAGMLAIHYAHRIVSQTETVSSSTSPSHTRTTPEPPTADDRRLQDAATEPCPRLPAGESR